jgi:protein SDA1
MGKPSRSASHLPHNYPQLQNLIKRDAESYREEFLQQYQHFKSALAILKMRPDSVEDHFEPLASFLSHVVYLYPGEAKEFPEILFDLLENDSVTLPPSIRRCLVQCLLLLRKKKLVELERMLKMFFRLFRIKDKLLREQLYDSIVGEIKRANTPHRNNALNKSLQNMMFSILQPSQAAEGKTGPARNDSAEAIAAQKALQVIIELYRRNIWGDVKTVNVVATACVAQISNKVTVTALNFFLGRMKKKSALSLADESESESEDESEDEDAKASKPTLRDLMYKMQVAGSTKARKSKLKRHMAAAKRHKAKEDEKQNPAFAAIHLLNDPYGFVERLFGLLKKSTDSFEFKLLMINVISRVIGAHKLIFLDLYSFLLKYIQPHQKNVTQVLAYTAQASHELVPPDVIAPVLKAIAHHFVSEHCRNEVIAAGLNGLAQICMRCPLAMDSTLLQDLAGYKGYNDKSVMMAARSLISLYREKNPELLHKKDRGKEASMALQRGTFSGPTAYGQSAVSNDLEGAELLAANDNDNESPSGDDNGEDEFEECSDISGTNEGDDEEGWQEFSDDSDADTEEGDEEEADETQSVAVSEKKAEVSKMLSLAAQKIFTAEDFARLKRKRMESQMASAASKDPRKGLVAKKARKSSAAALGSDNESAFGDDDDEEVGPSEIVRPRSIETLAKKPKADYNTRMESIKAGREGRREFGSKKGKDSRGSTTNREKSKKKNNVMMAHKLSVRLKKKRSFREVQATQRAHITRMKKMK